jgi:hypothetical protein
MSAVTGPRVTVIQQRRRFVSMKGDSTVFGPEATSQRASVGSTNGTSLRASEGWHRVEALTAHLAGLYHV